MRRASSAFRRTSLPGHLGTIREVVSRLLRNLAGQGLIALAPRKVTILDRERLERMIPGATDGLV